MAEKQCNICKDDLGLVEEDIMGLPCGHLFHSSCVATLAQMEKRSLSDVRCPVCRTGPQDWAAAEAQLVGPPTHWVRAEQDLMGSDPDAHLPLTAQALAARDSLPVRACDSDDPLEEILSECFGTPKREKKQTRQEEQEVQEGQEGQGRQVFGHLV